MPTLSGGAAATAATLRWDLRPSFVNYVDAGGRIAVWNGASRVAGGGFAFTFVSATTSDAGTPGTPADDYTVARFRGRIDFCYPTHSFRIALADPIVVIDGGQPRIILTGDSYQGVPPDAGDPDPRPPRRVRHVHEPRSDPRHGHPDLDRPGQPRHQADGGRRRHRQRHEQPGLRPLGRGPALRGIHARRHLVTASPDFTCPKGHTHP
ncbi:HtaA domain-containing protein [Svornostia abyssi]|uniref:HtaA domain-containing protein n=1 Tax=Svornostia abyssi TaxID=2898438 RepID=A0ABY5PHZ1_9ACTN|nr:HtaA domain-containing protein [Parviterribacteraceae bacterium J379]